MNVKALLFFGRCCAVLSAVAIALPATAAAVHDGEAVDHPHTEHPHLAASPTLTIEQVLNAALRLAPEQSMGDAYQQQATSQQQFSRRMIAGRPRLNASYWDDQNADDTGLREIELGLEVDLWRWGERSNAQSLARSYASGADAWQDYQRLIVVGRLRNALHQLNASTARREHAVNAVTDAQALLAVSEKRLRAGDISRAARMQSEALLLEARQQLLNADAELVDAERLYITLTGLRQRPAQFSESPPARQNISTQHPRLRLLLAKRQQQQDRLTQARHAAAGNTTLAIGVRRERGSNIEPEIESLGLSLSIPFGGASYTAAASSNAAIALSDADVELKQAQQQLQQRFHEVEHELDVIAESITYAEQSRDLSKRQWQMAKKAFATGESDIRPTIVALQHYRASQLQWQLLTLRQQALISSLRQTVGETL